MTVELHGERRVVRHRSRLLRRGTSSLTAEGAGQSPHRHVHRPGRQRPPGDRSATSTSTRRRRPSPPAPAPPANANGWNNTDVTVTFTGTDALSGIATCDAPPSSRAEGAGPVRQRAPARTRPATQRTGHRGGINIDKTAPSLSPSVTPTRSCSTGRRRQPRSDRPLSGIAGQSCGALDTNSVGSSRSTAR